MEKDVLETVEDALETIEGVLEEINETIDDSDQDLISGTSAFSMAIRWEHGCNFFQ